MLILKGKDGWFDVISNYKEYSALKERRGSVNRCKLESASVECPPTDDSPGKVDFAKAGGIFPMMVAEPREAGKRSNEKVPEIEARGFWARACLPTSRCSLVSDRIFFPIIIFLHLPPQFMIVNTQKCKPLKSNPLSFHIFVHF